MHIFSTFKKLFEEQEKEIVSKLISNQTENKPKFEKKPFNKSYPNKFENKNKPNFEEKPKNSCYVLFAKDGDTFVGMHNNEKKIFRLAGIDAPEKGKAWAKEATNFLNDQIKKKLVYLEFLGEDPYEREIVEVYLDKEKTQHVNKMLINKGFATSERYTNSNHEKTHGFIDYVENEIAEKIADINNEGIWSNEPPPIQNSNEITEPTQRKRIRFGKK